MKQIPNIFTLLNLFFGCIAIVLIMQSGLMPVVSAEGEQMVVLPERMYWASLFIGIAAVIDFLDGFVARLLKATSDMGKQLDSLADVVSFGVAPALIIYQFLRLSFARQEDGLDISTAWLLPAFIIPCAGAYRLARYNLDTTPSYGFKGVPIPAAGLLVASFPLIYWYTNQPWVDSLLLSKWFWYAVILIISYLMVSTLPMMALKSSERGFKSNMPKYALLAAAVICGILFQWLAVPLIFILYIVLSLASPLADKVRYADKDGLAKNP
ncbi:phosphatidylcholine/phosphatidylserine synthase [Segetibacter sp. 3557_3]|uniref:CDP-alcohol phosphatidyltransferase family protein n=1 Tax=Segetibacter sp. 3557_3 TaxID=2547429 RepID=UPI001058D4BB|nr:phosphatidylcholine/phosphatidylserine synthase [Segetibacter sp. 3557_3]TDH25668.1 phosphatidylcholine/phosphatidylserine synthase [Segetibacter sp. 3557_3]